MFKAVWNSLQDRKYVMVTLQFPHLRQRLKLAVKPFEIIHLKDVRICNRTWNRRKKWFWTKGAWNYLSGCQNNSLVTFSTRDNAWRSFAQDMGGAHSSLLIKSNSDYIFPTLAVFFIRKNKTDFFASKCERCYNFSIKIKFTLCALLISLYLFRMLMLCINLWIKSTLKWRPLASLW